MRRPTLDGGVRRDWCPGRMKKRHRGNKEQIRRKEGGERDLQGKIKRVFLEFFWQELESIIYTKILDDRHTSKAKRKNWETLGGKQKQV